MFPSQFLGGLWKKKSSTFLFRSSRQKCTVTHAVYFASVLWKVRTGGGWEDPNKACWSSTMRLFYLLYPNPASTTRPLQLATQPPTKRTNTCPNTKSRGHPAPQTTIHTHTQHALSLSWRPWPRCPNPNACFCWCCLGK